MVQVKHDTIWTGKEEVGIKRDGCIHVTTLNADVAFKSRSCTRSPIRVSGDQRRASMLET